MSYADWKVGDRVVCVDASNMDFRQGEELPKQGSVYTIREIRDLGRGVAVRLNEIVNPPKVYRPGVMECGFFARRFRKVQPRKTDIAIFKAMLVNPRLPTPVNG